MAPKKISTFLVVLLSVFSSFAQEKFTLSGTIIDANSNETLIGVNVVIPELKTGVTTNEYGFYSITLPKGIYSVQISYLGYQNIEESINLNQNTKNNFNLYSNETALKEVVITGNKTKIDIKKPEMSVNKLSISAIKKMPVVLGEVDVFLHGAGNVLERGNRQALVVEHDQGTDIATGGQAHEGDQLVLIDIKLAAQHRRLQFGT